MTEPMHCDHECVCKYYFGMDLMLQNIPCKDIKCRNRIRARGSLSQYPNSTELLAMAHKEWKNREERRSLHEEKDWCAGWITGFLTPTKPVAQQAIDKQRGIAQIAAYSYIKSIAESRNMSFYDLVDQLVDLLKAQQAPAELGKYVGMDPKPSQENNHSHTVAMYDACQKCKDALIAQEREKWEREQQTNKERCRFLKVSQDGDFSGETCYAHENSDCRKMGGKLLVSTACFRILQHPQSAAIAAQAREDVLDELAQMYANVPVQFLEGTYRLHSEWKEKIESLRHGQEREPE